MRYKYDALGRRIQRYTSNGQEDTKFIYDGMDVVADDNFGTLTKYQNGLGIDNKLKLVTNGTSKYFLSDYLGSTNALTDSSGTITEQTAYDSFGNATNNLSTRYQYTGREYDNFTGLHYYRARWYDANVGRFISEDPIGFAGGDINLFAYVRNNPHRFTDPKGTAVFVPLLIAAGIVFAAEGGLHLYLSTEANAIKWSDSDGKGRKRHCWVNCMSVRIHLGSPMPVMIAGYAQEGVNMYQYWRNNNLEEGSDDSIKDIQANQRGQAAGYIFWKGCQQLCEECQPSQ